MGIGRNRSGRPCPKEKQVSGGQPGHKGKTLRRVEQPDRVYGHLSERCKVCGREIAADEPHPVVSRSQEFDLPEPKLEVIEHRLGQIECCGEKQCGEYSPVQYGPGVRALVVKLSVDHKMPLEQISRLFSDLYGYELNGETVERALEAEGVRPLAGGDFHLPQTGKALPRSLGTPSTVHDRFQERRRAGVFERMRQAGLLEYDEKVRIKWEWEASWWP